MNSTASADCTYSEALQWANLIINALIITLQVLYTGLYALLKRTSILDLVRLKPTPPAKVRHQKIVNEVENVQKQVKQLVAAVNDVTNSISSNSSASGPHTPQSVSHGS
jgi:uncharacterized protein YlxW (UPF0749 family)